VPTDPLDPLLAPPHPASSKPASTIPTNAARRLPARRPPQTTTTTIIPSTIPIHFEEDEERPEEEGKRDAPNTDAPKLAAGLAGRAAAALALEVCIVTVAELADVPLKITEPGEIVHVAAGGPPLQLSATV
jgi:hypothetical protein